MKIQGKLLFPLCFSCANKKYQTCNHGDEERKFIGTWTTPELQKAVTLGYRILTIFEVWHFEASMSYDPRNGEDGLFNKFIDKWLKIKVEASGWPSSCLTEEDKENYIRRYYENEGISLERNKIESNPGLRSLGKLMANSYWGKHGQNPNMRKTEFIKDPAKLFERLSDATLEVYDLYLISDDVILCNYEKTQGFIQNPKHSNIAIAAFTTTYARFKLYELLERLERRVLYYDTDSVIFTGKPGEWIPETGEFLGNLTDEIAS